jgi:hypothetical protein
MSIEQLKGKILTEITGLAKDSDETFFTTDDGKKYKMYHSQSCCESVYIEDVVGDIQDLMGLPILEAEESTNNDNPKEGSDSHTWTFYKLGTIKGHVTIRWYGSSNGWYSERVDFEEVGN